MMVCFVGVFVGEGGGGGWTLGPVVQSWLGAGPGKDKPAVLVYEFLHAGSFQKLTSETETAIDQDKISEVIFPA